MGHWPRLLVSVFVLSRAVFAADENKISGDISPIIKSRPDATAAGSELITHEALRLGLGGANPVIQIPEGTNLDRVLRDRLEAIARKEAGPKGIGQDLRPKGALRLGDVLKALQPGPLGGDDTADLLAVLRLQQDKQAGESDLDAARRLAVDEIAQWAADPYAKGAPPLPAELKGKFADALKDLLKKDNPGAEIKDADVERMLRSPAGLARAAQALGADAFSLPQWLRLLGSTRIAARQNRDTGFLAGMRAEIGERIARFELDRQRKAGVKTPRQPFFGRAPNFPKAPPPQGQRSPAPKGALGGPGFQKSPPGGSHKGRTVSFRSPPPAAPFLDPDQRERINDKRQEGHVSLQMRTVYRDDYNAVSSCQITMVDKRNDGDGCSWKAVTARHCIEDDAGNLFSDIAIAPFPRIFNPKVEVDPNGGDMAVVAFNSTCAEVPVIPMAISVPGDGDGLVVYGRMPLVGQANSSVIDSPVGMVMDVRFRENNGLGIYQGDSGGAVTNSRGELVGVISAKFVDQRFHGLGIFATGESLRFANNQVNPLFDAYVSGGLRRRLDEYGAGIYGEHSL